MKNNILVVVCSLLLMLANIAYAKQAKIISYDLPSLISESELICIGTVTNVKFAEAVDYHTGFYDEPGKEITIPTQKAIADFQIDTIIKGKVNQKIIKVLFYKNIIKPGPNKLPFTELANGENLLLFMNYDPENSIYNLVGTASHGQTKIILENIKNVQEDDSCNATRKLLNYLIESLQCKNASVKIGLLNKIHEMGYVLYCTAATEAGESGIKIRSDIGESTVKQFEEFIQLKVIPKVVPLMKNEDASVRYNAVVTVGYLQDPDVIPDLISIIELKDPTISGFAKDALREYRNPKAVRYLINALSTKDPQVQASSILRKIRPLLRSKYLLPIMV